MNKYFRGLLFGVSVLPALLIMPAMADYTWSHPDVDSYSSIDGSINYSAEDANVITGTGLRNIVNGNVTLTLDGVSQTGTQEINGVYGNLFLKSSHVPSLGESAMSNEQKLLRQYVDGDVTVIVKNNSLIARNVIGNQFYTDTPGEITGDIGLSGKTTITIEDSSVMKSVRGANIGDATTSTDTTLPVKVNDIEININNSFVKDEVISTGSYVSAGNVTINVTGNSVIGYTARDSNTATSALDDGSWIIAGAQRNRSHVGNTEINLNTAGNIRVAGDVNVGSRERTDGYDTDENSVAGNATLNMLGGGNINIGGDVRAYHVGGATELNLNDITVNVVGAIKEFQTINMNENATLTVGSLIMVETDVLNVVLADMDAYSQISAGTLNVNGATLNMTVRNPGTYNVISAETVTSDFSWNLNNSLYNLSQENGVVTATVKSVEDIAEQNGLEQDSANAVSGLTQSTSSALNDLGIQIQEKLAEGTPEAKQEVEHITKAIHPETESVVQSAMTSIQHTVANLTSARMATPRFGRNGGDMDFTSGGIWAQGLFNKAKQNDAFHGYTRGIAAGIDGTVNRAFMIGAGYAYTDSDITGSARDTDVKSNTAFVYAQYKPNEWYMNAMGNYSWSQYSEKDAVVTADYDVNSYGGAVATGYDFISGLTPELGLRYIHVDGKTYTNSLGIKSELKSADYMTAMFGTKYGFDVAANRYMLIRPELRAVVKYDVISDKTSATVAMPGVPSYTLNGDRLSRTAGEFGIGLSTKYKELNISLNYDIEIRKDYTSQTGMLKFKYEF